MSYVLGGGTFWQLCLLVTLCHGWGGQFFLAQYSAGIQDRLFRGKKTWKINYDSRTECFMSSKSSFQGLRSRDVPEAPSGCSIRALSPSEDNWERATFLTRQHFFGCKRVDSYRMHTR